MLIERGGHSQCRLKGLTDVKLALCVENATTEWVVVGIQVRCWPQASVTRLHAGSTAGTEKDRIAVTRLTTTKVTGILKCRHHIVDSAVGQPLAAGACSHIVLFVVSVEQ